MTTIAAFLLARIAEDEATAKAGVGAPDLIPLGCHDPERVLAECAAKRAIVEKAQRADEAFGRQINPATSAASFALTEVLCRLAAPYADHPDYDPAWKVEP